MERRKFLKSTVILGVPTLFLSNGINSLIRGGLKISSNYTFSTESANFIFIGGIHGLWKFDSSPELPRVANGLTGVFLESGGADYLGPDRRGLKTPIFFEDEPFYEKIIIQAKQQEIPVLLGEIPFKGLGSALATSESLLVPGLAAILGSYVAIGKDTKKLSRRHFLERSIGGAAGLWGYSYFVKNFTTEIAELFRQPWAKEVRKAVSFMEFSHPEDFLLTFRNCLIAAKLLKYSEQFHQQEGKEATIGIVMGGSHEYITEYLKRGRGFCLRVLDFYPEGVLKTMFGGDIEKYYPVLVEACYNRDFIEGKVMIDNELQKKVGKTEQETNFGSPERR